MCRADDGQPVLGLRDRGSCGPRRACRRLREPLSDAPSNTSAMTSRGSSSGNAAIDSANRTRPPIANTSLIAFAAAISPKVRASSTSGGKKSTVPMIARSSLTRYAAASSGGCSPAISSAGAAGCAEPGQRLRQQVGAELRGTTAAIGQRRQSQARDFGQTRHVSMMARRGRGPAAVAVRPPLPSARGSGWVPVGPPVFKTGDAALGVAWWVRLPRVPATERRCRRSRPVRAALAPERRSRAQASCGRASTASTQRRVASRRT